MEREREIEKENPLENEANENKAIKKQTKNHVEPGVLLRIPTP